jgi:mono/diheme cytochrome c family protein
MNAIRIIKRIALLMALVGLVASVSAQDRDRARGEAVYNKWCAPCHDAGTDHPGTLALSAKYAGVKSPVIKEWTDLPPVVTKQFVRHGVSIMPFFRKTEISDDDLDNLAAYLARNTPAGDTNAMGR